MQSKYSQVGFLALQIGEELYDISGYNIVVNSIDLFVHIFKKDWISLLFRNVHFEQQIHCPKDQKVSTTHVPHK